MMNIIWVLMGLFLWACGAEEGTRAAATGEICAEGNALAQCPPNTRGVLEAEAESSCDSAGSLDLESATATSGAGASGAVSQVCTGSGSCRVVCELIEICEYGIDSVSAETGDIQCLPAPCGNGLCESGENPTNCAQDCMTSCGDGDCAGDENVMNCPTDCTTMTACGNDRCEAGENPMNCPQDCAAACGNNTCEPGEDPTICPQDCAAETACGNGECENGESTETCPADCVAMSACGNGECENGEDTTNCPADCTARVCESDATRCFDGDLQRCTLRGEWENTPCEDGQICSEENGSAQCGVPCAPLCQDLQACIEGSMTCGEFNEENYEPFCLGRCAEYPGRFQDYADDTSDCARALTLNLFTDHRDDPVPFCAPAVCQTSCNDLWTRCVTPGERDNEQQCGQVGEDEYIARTPAEFFVDCHTHCQGRPQGHQQYVDRVQSDELNRLCNVSFQLGLFECRPAECGNGRCEYGEAQAGCGMMNDCR